MTNSHLDETHDPSATSWVESANAADTDFPLSNLPFGIFRHDFEERPRVGIAIGDRVLDCLAATRAGFFNSVDPAVRDALQSWTLNPLMALGRTDARAVRRVAHRLLSADTAEGTRARSLSADILASNTAIGMRVPAEIGDYSDFYASVFHATNVGSMFRPDNPLLPNYKWMPIGYHGRASSIVASGTPVRRPRGQSVSSPDGPPSVGPSVRMDYELEIGAFVARGNRQGDVIPLSSAEDHLFGLCLVNDWSARDLQQWEYQPLGPFLSKSYATTVSPWVVTLDALEPFRIPAFVRPPGDPAPLAYLDDATDRERGGFGITLEVWLRTAAMRAAGRPAERLSRGDFGSMYWTLAQMLTHHASAGCNVQSGDLIASGTVSGPGSGSRGCLLELAWRGQTPVQLSTGESRAFLQDGDEVTLRGWCERDGFRRIGFGDCSGEVLPALA
ncbi:MAG: fumarylacetoacetase [Gemmatimonadaceae bacterium]|nr:fumarylacetoacetase [Gemmatimonadaceae bacterium]